MSELNLYQRINEVRKSIDYIKKDKSVSTGAGGGSYKAVTHDQVTAMTRNLMVKHGIVCHPYLVNSKMNPKEGDAKQNRYEATYDFIFTNIDNFSEFLTIRIEAHAMDSGDKAPGKAISYAKKYAVLKLFDIESGEDDESIYIDVDDYIESITNCDSTGELEAVFKTIYKMLQSNPKDLKKVIKVKDSMKAKFAKEEKNA